MSTYPEPDSASQDAAAAPGQRVRLRTFPTFWVRVKDFSWRLPTGLFVALLGLAILGGGVEEYVQHQLSVTTGVLGLIIGGGFLVAAFVVLRDLGIDVAPGRTYVTGTLIEHGHDRCDVAATPSEVVVHHMTTRREVRRYLPILLAGPDAAGGSIRLALSQDSGWSLRPGRDLELLASAIAQGTGPDAARTAAQLREVATWRHCPSKDAPAGFRQVSGSTQT